MAIYHCQFRPIQRSKRRSVIQLVAYITGLKLRSARTGRTYRRRTPGDVVRFACVGSNLPTQDLWQKAESAEKRKDSIEGRHLIVALPCENSLEEHWKMLMAMAEEISQLLGVPVMVALHDNSEEQDKPRNPHGHLIFATREYDHRIQAFMAKTRALDVATTGSVIIEGFRKKWEDIVNAGLPAGVPKVSRLSHARAGRNRVPRRHLGEQATEMERKGIRTRYGNFNPKVDQLDRIAAQRAKMENLPTPAPKLSHAERQRQLGLERELAIAHAAIASMPPVRKNAPIEDRVSIIAAGMADAAKAPICPEVFDPEAPREEADTAGKVLPEKDTPAPELVPMSLEDELSLALMQRDMPPPKDLSTP